MLTVPEIYKAIDEKTNSIAAIIIKEKADLNDIKKLVQVLKDRQVLAIKDRQNDHEIVVQAQTIIDKFPAVEIALTRAENELKEMGKDGVI